MNKEALLLENFKVLSKDPLKHEEALKTLILQLLEIDPKVAIDCWELLVRRNLPDIRVDFHKKDFDYDSMGGLLVERFEKTFCDNQDFKEALGYYANNQFLMDVIYAKSPLSEFFSGKLAISYLIRHDRLDEAENMLAAVYSNRSFTNYADMWDRIVYAFKYGDLYNPGMYFAESLQQPEHIQEFCFKWINRIPDEVERTAARTFGLQMV